MGVVGVDAKGMEQKKTLEPGQFPVTLGCD